MCVRLCNGAVPGCTGNRASDGHLRGPRTDHRTAQPNSNNTIGGTSANPRLSVRSLRTIAPMRRPSGLFVENVVLRPPHVQVIAGNPQPANCQNEPTPQTHTRPVHVTRSRGSSPSRPRGRCDWNEVVDD